MHSLPLKGLAPIPLETSTTTMAKPQIVILFQRIHHELSLLAVIESGLSQGLTRKLEIGEPEKDEGNMS